MDLRNVGWGEGGMDWIGLNWNGERWWAVVNAEMNLWIP
jgi:hypothetical protein